MMRHSGLEHPHWLVPCHFVNPPLILTLTLISTVTLTLTLALTLTVAVLDVHRHPLFNQRQSDARSDEC